MPERIRSKAIGPARSALDDYLTSNRIAATPGVSWTVRGGETAKSASDSDFSRWWTATERSRGDAAVAVLVVQRRDRETGSWWAAMDIATLITLASGDEIASAAYLLGDAPRYLIRMTLADAVEALRWAGLVTPTP